MESSNRGQPPARQTKVAHHCSRCLKADVDNVAVSDCNYDTMSSKPGGTGKDMADILQSARVWE